MRIMQSSRSHLGPAGRPHMHEGVSREAFHVTGLQERKKEHALGVD